jgi:type IV pilus assembly protein PilW
MEGPDGSSDHTGNDTVTAAMNLPLFNTQRGASLLELLVALLMSGMLGGILYQTFLAQQLAYETQEQVVDMQQNLRGAIEQMTREIRMAGYRKDILESQGNVEGFTQIISPVNNINRTGTNDDQITIVVADKAITYRLQPEGITPAMTVLVRDENNGTGGDVVAEGIEDLQFKYILADGSFADSPPDPSQIRMVQVEITSRTKNTDHHLSGDGYIRRTSTSLIKIRNLGI